MLEGAFWERLKYKLINTILFASSAKTANTYCKCQNKGFNCYAIFVQVTRQFVRALQELDLNLDTGERVTVQIIF